MSNLFRHLYGKLTAAEGKKIVFPEGTDERVLLAASRLAKENLLIPVLIGNKEHILDAATRLSADIRKCDIQDPESYDNMEAMIQSLVNRRNGKVTADEAEAVLKDVNYFGTMLVYLGEADGLVSGAVHSTANTVRPALQIIKTKLGVNKTSGVFVMVRDSETYLYADCAINIAPTGDDLAEIAVETAATAKLFDLDPKVALLSFSTKGSATSPETERVRHAFELAMKQAPHLIMDGEMQFDAAFVPEVAKIKAPNSPLKGQANVFIFPSLEAGNIAYKLTERLAGFEAIGPILQGLNKPVNDLSRGCSTEDVFKLAIITAAQAI